VKGHNKGRSDREVLEHHHGECREPLKLNAYKHGNTAATTVISIPIPLGIFKLILPLGWLSFACTYAEKIFEARRQGSFTPCAPLLLAFQSPAGGHSPPAGE